MEMKKTIKALLTALILSTNVFAGGIAKFTQDELTEIYRRCSLANPNSINRRITAEKFIVKAEKTAFECEKLSIQDNKKGYKNRAQKLKDLAKALKTMCNDMKRNKKLETGRYTDLEKFFERHNNIVDFMELGLISSTMRGIGKTTKDTGSFLARNKGTVANIALLAVTFVLGYTAAHKWPISTLPSLFTTSST